MPTDYISSPSLEGTPLWGSSRVGTCSHPFVLWNDMLVASLPADADNPYGILSGADAQHARATIVGCQGAYAFIAAFLVSTAAQGGTPAARAYGQLPNKHASARRQFPQDLNANYANISAPGLWIPLPSHPDTGNFGDSQQALKVNGELDAGASLSPSLIVSRPVSWHTFGCQRIMVLPQAAATGTNVLLAGFLWG